LDALMLRCLATGATRAANMRWRGLALDMDCTTLNSDHELTAATVTALQNARAAGLQLIVATGRPMNAVQPIIDRLGMDRVPTVCFNGACAILMNANKPEDNKVLLTNGLSAELATRVIDFCREQHLCISFALPAGSVASPQDEAQEQRLSEFEGMEHVKQERVPDIMELVNQGTLPLKIVALVDDPEKAAAIAKEALPDDVCYVVAAEYHIEFLSPDTCKGFTLSKVCSEHLQLPLDRVMAFGDNHNDKEMLTLVGEGVAMKNAKDAVKDVAHRVSNWTNDEEGVAREVEALLAARLAP